MEGESSAQALPSGPYTKRKETINGKVKKKRKHNDLSSSELPTPAKRHRQRHHSESPSKTDASLLHSSSMIDSPFYEQTSSLYLPLSPISFQHPKSGLCAEHLSPLILTYFPPFNGVILSYCNVRLSTDPDEIFVSNDTLPVLARSIDEYAVSFVWVTADFLVFKPQKHNLMEGWINLQNEGNLGLVILNFFNVSISRENLPRDWVWLPGGRTTQGLKNGEGKRKNIASEEVHEGQTARTSLINAEEGHFEDEYGRKVEGLIRFKIKDVETSKGSDRENDFVSIEGTMLDEGLVNQIADEENFRANKLPKSPVEKRGGQEYLMSGALLNG